MPDRTPLLMVALLAAPMAVAFLSGCGGGGSKCGPGSDDVPPPLEVDIEPPVLCEVDQDCPSGEDCYAGLCLISCGDESDCNPAERCDLDDPAFLDDCFVDADCPEAGMVCDDGTCRDPCAVAADCPHPADSCEAGVCLTSHCLLHTWVGLLAVDELEVVGAGAEHNTLVQAHFYDFTFYAVQEAGRQEFLEYPACVVYTSQPVPHGDRIPLKVERVTFSGLSGGDVVLEPDESGHLPTDLLPRRGFAGETVTVEVTSGTGLDCFPALTAQIPAPPQPVLTRLGEWQPVNLDDAPEIDVAIDRIEPLEVRWEPAGSEWVEVKLLPGSGSQTEYAKLWCITYDDGCLEIPAAAVALLAMDQATNFRFRIEHHHFALHETYEGGQLKALTRIETSSSLEGIVLR